MKVVVKKKDPAVPVVIGTEFIKLESAMKLANIVPSGGSAKLEIQESDARWWRDACVQYFMEFSGMPIPSDVAQPERPLEELKKIKLNMQHHN